MANLPAQHYLEVYQNRKKMQEQGITNPPAEIIAFTQQLVDRLSQLPPTEPIELRDGTFLDSKGNVIATMPQ